MLEATQIDPMPLRYELSPISALFTPQFFPTDKDILTKAKNMAGALNPLEAVGDLLTGRPRRAPHRARAQYLSRQADPAGRG